MPPRKKASKVSVDVPQSCPTQNVSSISPAGEPFESILDKSVLKTILEAATTVPVLTMRWGVDGMSLIGMDKSHVLLLHCFLPLKAFHAYACHEAPVVFDVRVESLVQMLNRFDAHNTVMIRVDMGDIPHRTERRVFNKLMSEEDRCAYRAATMVLNVGAFHDASLTAEDFFVTWDALGDVMPFLAEEDLSPPWRDSPGGPPTLTLGAKTVGSRTVTSQLTLPVDAPGDGYTFFNALIFNFTATMSMPSRDFSNLWCKDRVSVAVKCGPLPSISMSVSHEASATAFTQTVTFEGEGVAVSATSDFTQKFSSSYVSAAVKKLLKFETVGIFFEIDGTMRLQYTWSSEGYIHFYLAPVVEPDP